MEIQSLEDSEQYAKERTRMGGGNTILTNPGSEREENN